MLDYKNVLTELIKILNDLDPEGLLPGLENGSPVSEYEQEASAMLVIIMRLKKTSKFNNGSLLVEIDKLWINQFGHSCKKKDQLSQNILTSL